MSRRRAPRARSIFASKATICGGRPLEGRPSPSSSFNHTHTSSPYSFLLASWPRSCRCSWTRTRGEGPARRMADTSRGGQPSFRDVGFDCVQLYALVGRPFVPFRCPDGFVEWCHDARGESVWGFSRGPFWLLCVLLITIGAGGASGMEIGALEGRAAGGGAVVRRCRCSASGCSCLMGPRLSPVPDASWPLNAWSATGGHFLVRPLVQPQCDGASR